MATLIQRSAHHNKLHTLLTDPQALAAVHADTEIPEVVTDWLHQLKRLKGVPFDYLVWLKEPSALVRQRREMRRTIR